MRNAQSTPKGHAKRRRVKDPKGGSALKLKPLREASRNVNNREWRRKEWIKQKRTMGEARINRKGEMKRRE